MSCPCLVHVTYLCQAVNCHLNIIYKTSFTRLSKLFSIWSHCGDLVSMEKRRFRETWSIFINTWHVKAKKTETDYSQRYPMTRQEAKGKFLNLNRIVCQLFVFFVLLWGWSNTKMGYSGRLWSLHPWRYS